MSTPITTGDRVYIEKGCKARNISKNSTAVVKEITELGADYGHSVKVTLSFVNSFLSGKTISLYARHINRLGDDLINLNDGRPEHKVQVRKVAK